MAARDYLNSEQLQLFDPGPAMPKDPSAMSPDEWHEAHADDLVFHSTFRGDEFRTSPSFHAGTQKSAQDRLRHVADTLRNSEWGRDRYYGRDPDFYDWDDDPRAGEEEEHTGRMYAFYLPAEAQHTPLGGFPQSDSLANTADLLHWTHNAGYESDEVPRSVDASSIQMIKSDVGRTGNPFKVIKSVMTKDIRMSQGRDLVNSVRALRDKKALPYVNAAEDRGSVSFVVPKHSGAKTWEDDVLAPGSQASPLAQSFAAQRKEQGTAGSVPITQDNKRVGLQLALPVIPGGRPEKMLFASRSPISSIQFRTKRGE